MAKKQKTSGAPAGAGDPPPAGPLSRFQKFATERLDRRDLKAAPYNPRQITAGARRKLKKVLEKLGLVQPLVVNKRSGNLVAGHQRLGILDQLEGRPDYQLDCAVVDLDDAQERAANLALNNSEVAADWDLGKLRDLFAGPVKLDVEASGFDMARLYQMFGESPFAVAAEAAQLEEMAKNLQSLRADSERVKNTVRTASRYDQDFYHVLVHQGQPQREALGRRLGQEEDNRYLAPGLVEELLDERDRLLAEVAELRKRVADGQGAGQETQEAAGA